MDRQGFDQMSLHAGGPRKSKRPAWGTNTESCGVSGGGARSRPLQGEKWPAALPRPIRAAAEDPIAVSRSQGKLHCVVERHRAPFGPDGIGVGRQGIAGAADVPLEKGVPEGDGDRRAE